MTIRTGGECEWPDAVITHRVPTLEDACHMVCQCAAPPFVTFGSPSFSSFTITDRFVLARQGRKGVFPSLLLSPSPSARKPHPKILESRKAMYARYEDSDS
jgi:hypothetical protein